MRHGRCTPAAATACLAATGERARRNAHKAMGATETTNLIQSTRNMIPPFPTDSVRVKKQMCCSVEVRASFKRLGNSVTTRLNFIRHSVAQLSQHYAILRHRYIFIALRLSNVRYICNYIAINDNVFNPWKELLNFVQKKKLSCSGCNYK